MSQSHVSVSSTSPRVGAGGVFIAGVALVVSASTLVTECTGFLRLGGTFAIALLLGFGVVVPVALAASDLAVSHPRIGGIYAFTRAVVRGAKGRRLALLLSLCFFGTFLFGGAGETLAGAHAVRSLVGSEAPAPWFALALMVPAVVANICGLRCATRLTGALLVIMLGVRWAIGLGGLAGWARTGEWSWINLLPADGWRWSGEHGILSCGLALGFWSFVGIEGATSLAAETRSPRRDIPRGVLWGLLAILATTLVMGLGALGTQSPAAWSGLLAPGAADVPHLALAEAMFGATGRIGMAVSSVAATLSTLLIAYAAVPRMIVALSRDGLFFGPLSRYFRAVNPRTGTPVRATLLVVGIQFLVFATQAGTTEILQAAAYLWFLRYLVVLALAFVHRRDAAGAGGVLPRRAMLTVMGSGAGLVAGAWYVAFAGSHAEFGARAALVLVVALAAAATAWRMRPRLALGRRAIAGDTPLPPVPAAPLPTLNPSLSASA